jgi:uncharacterized membrane protein
MRESSAIISIVHLLLYIAIGLNIFVFRQITVFVYLSFIPGFVLLKILRLKETSVVDTVLFSVGLSIAFLMLVGLLINELYLAVGISRPLSTIPLTMVLSSLTLILFFVGYRQDLSENLSSIKNNFTDLKPIITTSVILVLPVLLGVIGALYINQPVLLLMIIVVAALYVLTVFSTKLIPSKLYPLVIFAVSMALTFQLLLTSRYTIGYDAQVEYYVFRLTSINGYWHFLPVSINSMAEVTFNSMLSVTILPTIYSALMNINGEIVFKFFYSFVFSLVPVTLYRIYERQIGKSASLLSTFFFISGTLVFYGVEPLSLNRQIVAEFFLVLSILVLLGKKISVEKRRLLLIVFGTAMTVSHYSIMFIYLALVFSIYVILKIKGKPDEVLNSAIVFFLFTVAFSWYSIAVSPLTTLSYFFQTVFSRFFTGLFIPATRGSVVSAFNPTVDFVSMAIFALFWVAHFFILVGILILFFKPAKTKLDPKHRTVAVLSAVILFLCVVVPNVGPAFNFERFYAIILLFLAPCFVLGGETLVGVSENVLRREHALRGRSLPKSYSKMTTAVLCAVLIGYFLSQSGFISCIAGASPLSSSINYIVMRTSTGLNLANNITFYRYFVSEQDVFGAVWLSNNRGESSLIYADARTTDGVLTSYGLVPRPQMSLLTSTTTLEQGDFIYLGQQNVLNGVILTSTAYFNASEISPLLNEANLVYSNGNSEIRYVSSPGS